MPTLRRRPQSTPADPAGAPPASLPDPAVSLTEDPAASVREVPDSMVPAERVPRTRAGATWVGLCAAVLVLVVLLVFLVQNTGSVEITFLWLHGTLPLALALLIAAAGTAILALVVGTARITQLRRLVRRR
jgi:lipopolysaccharide assembly protein A